MFKNFLKFFGLAWMLNKYESAKKRETIRKMPNIPFSYISKFKIENETPFLTEEQKGKTMTQLVLEHLQKYGSITCEGVEWYYGYNRGSAIIYKLKKRGFEIVTHKHHFVEGNGKKKTMSIYVLVK